MCGNRVEWRVVRGNAHTYVCGEHLIQAAMEYGGEACIIKIEGSTLCRWDGRLVDVTVEALRSIADRVVFLVMDKNADYGDAWQKQGMPGLATRISDKMCRIDQLIDGREVVVEDESLTDTLIDAIGYCMLGLLYLEARGCQNTPAKPVDLTRPV